MPDSTTPEKPQVPLISAAARGDYDAFSAALTESPDAISAVDANGRTALSLAAQAGHAKIVSALLDAGAHDSAAIGWTAAHHAAFGGHAEVLGALLSKGTALPTVPSVGTTSMTPLLLAASRGHIACLEKLVEASPESLSATDAHGRTALMHAASSGSSDAVKVLAKAGAPLNAVSSDGKTALMWAVLSHKPYTVGALVELGAAVDVRAPVPKNAAIVPGVDRSKGESAEDFANGKHAKDPTLRHIARYLRDWKEQREATPDATPPPMPPLPWVTYAEEQAAKKAAEAAAKAAAPKPVSEDEPAIAELGADDSDIFGDADAEPAATAGDAAAKKAVSFAAEGSAPTPVGSADPGADLDALD